ncbi:MAG: UDP-N-acetylmuramoyl-L-alanine--D-glutamate ligase [Pseudomonadales bacterium]|nr:UDP-N-acetylmuramoyl-L-alanine--D-glutamate ligase [Pseudomonadales bacterium]
MDNFKAIVGLGKTGYSCAKYLHRKGTLFTVLDDAAEPAYLEKLKNEMPGVAFEITNSETLDQAEEIIISPGVPLASKKIQQALAKGVAITGDIAIFSEATQIPLALITGSNGKSTVTDLLGAFSLESRISIGVGGNIGIPCLEILDKPHDANVLEVSSYQLEVADKIKCLVATILNLAPDHLNRYQSVTHYYATKMRIYKNCEVAVVNRQIGYPLEINTDARQISFGLDEPGIGDYGISVANGRTYICKGDTGGLRRIINVGLLKIKGQHNWLNIQAAMAIGEAIGIDEQTMLSVLPEYAGLRHRCEWVGAYRGVDYYNDSKATNPAATLAALHGMPNPGDAYLILGGLSKDADFTALADYCQVRGVKCLVFGEDRSEICRALNNKSKSFENLSQVTTYLQTAVKPGELVLFSPACASMDQYANYEQRGDHFRSLVAEAQS